MGIPERDIYLTGTLVDGQPTCTFPPTSYARVITGVVITNSVVSNVTVHRGTIDSQPIMTSNNGYNNMLTGRKLIPAGQLIFVRWDDMGSGPEEATARLSFERVDNPFEVNEIGMSAAEEFIRFLRIPSIGDDFIIITDTSQFPATLIAAYNALDPGVISGIIFWNSSTGRYAYIIELVYSVDVVGDGLCLAAGLGDDDSVIPATGTNVVELWSFINDPDGIGFTIGDFWLGNETTRTFTDGIINVGNVDSFYSGGSIDADDTVGVAFDQNRHLEDSGGTGSNATTTYQNLSTLCGTAFVAPLSGCVTLHYGGTLSNNTAAGGAGITPFVGEGTTVGAGTQVLAPADANSANFNGTPSASFNVHSWAAKRVTGLTPGADYNVSIRLRRFTSGGTATVTNCKVIVEPEP